MARNAIVTGAAVGIGRAIALQLAKDGCNLVINDWPSKQEETAEALKEVEATGVKAIVVLTDASNEAGVKEMIGRCVHEFGSLDIMVCNAGTAFVKSILETPWSEVERLFNVNFRSTYLGYQLAAEQMIKQGKGGRIIGAASAVAKKGFAFMSAYSSTKFAIRGLTQAAAQEWGRHGITVNAYCPGFIWTPLLQDLGAEIGIVMNQKGDDPRPMWASVCAAGRVGEPIDIAKLVSFFASEDSSFVTGQSWLADGGVLFD